MEYLEGQTLKEYKKGHNPSVNETLDIFMKLSSGLDHLHSKGIIHRDIKPSNIFITHDGEIKIIDFGISKWSDDPDSFETKAYQVVGTVQYSAPEVFLLSKSDEQADIYSLGITFLELFLSSPVFTGETVTELINQIKYEDPKLPELFINNMPDDALELIIMMVEKDKRDRFSTMKEVTEKIANLKEKLSKEFLQLSVADLSTKELNLKNKGLKKELKKDGNIFTMTLDQQDLNIDKKQDPKKSKAKQRSKVTGQRNI